MLSDVSKRIKEIKAQVAKKELIKARRMVEPLLLEVLKAIAAGQCKDYPPEDFAEEALKVFGIVDQGNVEKKVEETQVANNPLNTIPTMIYDQESGHWSIDW